MSGGAAGVPVAGSQKRRALSQPPLTIIFPVGLERQAAERALMLERLSERLVGGGIPEPAGHVVAAGDDGAAVGAELDGLDARCSRLLEGSCEGLERGCVMEVHHAVVIADEHGSAVGTECDDVGRRGQLARIADRLAGRGIPEADCPVGAAGHDSVPSGLNAIPRHGVVVAERLADGAAGCGVVNSGCSVVASNHDSAAVWPEGDAGRRGSPGRTGARARGWWRYPRAGPRNPSRR